MTELTQDVAQKRIREGLINALDSELGSQETTELLTATCETFYGATDGNVWEKRSVISTSIPPDELTFPYGSYVSLLPIATTEPEEFRGLFTFTAGEKDPRPVASLFISGKVDDEGKHTVERAVSGSSEMDGKQIITGVATLAMSAASRLP